MPPASRTTYSTGVRTLDDVTGGGAPGDLWVISGRRGVGKHLLALGIARHCAVTQAVPVRWLTGDDPRGLYRALLAAGARVPTTAFGGDDLTDEHIRRIDQVSADLARAPLTFYPGLTPTSVPRDATLAAEQPHIRILVLHGKPVTADPDTLALLKACAVVTGVWIVVVASDQGCDRKAVRDAARASADLCLWIEREDQDEPDNPRAGEADVWIMRPGRRGILRTIVHQPHYSRFVDIRMNEPLPPPKWGQR